MTLPQDFCERMRNMLDNEYDSFMESFNDSTSYSGIRINKRKSTAEQTMKQLTDELERVKWCSDGYYCDKTKLSGNHPYHIAGLCYFQEPSAMSAVEALNIHPDDFVLDMCAAPGGKATQAGAKLSQNGLLVANEIIPKRASVLAENIERLGISNSIVTNETPEKLSDKFPNFFDKIIVDAPCSGEGMFKKEPQAIEEWSINHTKTCAVRQIHILDCAYKMLKAGGYIVYSTCTFAPCENEGVVDYMLKTYQDLTLCDTGLDMLNCGNEKWADSSFDMSKTVRVFPHKHKGEGHFVALFKRCGTKTDRIMNTAKYEKRTDEGVKLFREFEKITLNSKTDGFFKMFGDNLYLVPHSVNTDGLKLVRGGLHLGICKKGRFEPSHAFLMSLNCNDIKNCLSYSADSIELNKYLHGETLLSDLKGYCAIAVEGTPIGWAKGSGGVLKNHYPKHLRLL